ncbi:MAG TPA: metalloregulator ArsR/SmtB family transcription factor [Humisphaera sp.]
MRTFLAITTALSDENRVRVLVALAARGELCVCQIVELLGLAPSTVSKHLSLLHAAGLLAGRKQGRWMYYRAVDPRRDRDVPPAAHAALKWATAALAEDARVLADAGRLDAILCESPEDLCKRQTKRATAGVNGSGGCCSSAPATPAAARWPRAGRGR